MDEERVPDIIVRMTDKDYHRIVEKIRLKDLDKLFKYDTGKSKKKITPLEMEIIGYVPDYYPKEGTYDIYIR